MKKSKAEDMLASEYFKACIYGLAGTGKTDLLRYLPRPLIMFDFDQKAHPLMGHKDIDIVSYVLENADQAKAKVPEFWRDLNQVRKEAEYATIVVDSITSLNRMVTRWAMLMAGKEADGKETQPVYGDIKRWYSTFFPAIVGIPANVVVLAHEQTKTTKLGDVINIRPLIAGSMGDELASIFPHNFHLEYIGGADERWKLHYRGYKKYVSSSSVFSGGSGYIEYRRDEDVYEKLIKAMKDDKLLKK